MKHLTTLLLVLFCTLGAWAQTSVTAVKPTGLGTSAQPYQIATPPQPALDAEKLQHES